MDIVEALFISSKNERLSCVAQDLRTGTELMRYKGSVSLQSHALQKLGQCHLIGANSTKPMLHVWHLSRQEQLSTVRYITPSRVNAMALTQDGNFLVAAISDIIYLWHMNSGRLLNTISSHYQDITCIRFTSNDEHFATAGKDGAVFVWNLTQAVAPLHATNVEATAPLYSFHDHGLPVTDVHMGIGGIRCFMYTVSLDRCCRVYDLSNGSLLLSLYFPVALRCVIADKLERNIFVGTTEGQVLTFHMSNPPRMKEYHLEENDQLPFNNGHSKGTAITALALSINTNQLISGGEDKNVCIWDIACRQLMKTIPQPGAISNLFVTLQHSSVFQPGAASKKHIFSKQLNRMITPDDTDDQMCIRVNVSMEYPKRRSWQKPQNPTWQEPAEEIQNAASEMDNVDMADDDDEQQASVEMVLAKAKANKSQKRRHAKKERRN